MRVIKLLYYGIWRSFCKVKDKTKQISEKKTKGKYIGWQLHDKFQFQRRRATNLNFKKVISNIISIIKSIDLFSDLKPKHKNGGSLFVMVCPSK